MSFDFNKVLTTTESEESREFNEQHTEQALGNLKDYCIVKDNQYDIYGKFREGYDKRALVDFRTQIKKLILYNTGNNNLRLFLDLEYYTSVFNKMRRPIYDGLLEHIGKFVKYINYTGLSFDNKLYITDHHLQFNKKFYILNIDMMYLLHELYARYGITPVFTGNLSIEDVLLKRPIYQSNMILLDTKNTKGLDIPSQEEYNEIYIPFGNMVKELYPVYSIMFKKWEGKSYLLTPEYYKNAMFITNPPETKDIQQYLDTAKQEVGKLVITGGKGGTLDIYTLDTPDKITSDEQYRQVITTAALYLKGSFSWYDLYYNFFGQHEHSAFNLPARISRACTFMKVSDHTVLEDLKSNFNWLCMHGTE